MKWYDLDVKDRIDLLKLYRSLGYSRQQAVEDFNNGMPILTEGGFIPQEEEEGSSNQVSMEEQKIPTIEDLIQQLYLGKQQEIEQLNQQLGMDPYVDLDIAAKLEEAHSHLNQLSQGIIPEDIQQQLFGVPPQEYSDDTEDENSQYWDYQEQQ